MKMLALVVSLLFAGSCTAGAQNFDAHDPHSPLRIVRTIQLTGVKGRIDHLAIDAEDNRLLVAEYGNGSVDEIDLGSGKATGRITGLREPQGIAWLSAAHEIAVACGDGSVSFYRVPSLEEVARIFLGDDADNVRIDPRNGHLIVGYGSGALAVIDPVGHRVLRQLRLPAHPEAFAILGSRVFVNVPDAHAIVIGDLDQARTITTLNTGSRSGNYPMAADESGSRIAVAFRSPPTLAILDSRSGSTVRSIPVCGDADDLYFRGQQLIAVCGQGFVQLVQPGPGRGYLRIATSAGARTGLLDPEGDRLIVAVPAGAKPAAIWELSFGGLASPRANVER